MHLREGNQTTSKVVSYRVRTPEYSLDSNVLQGGLDASRLDKFISILLFHVGQNMASLSHQSPIVTNVEDSYLS